MSLEFRIDQRIVHRHVENTTATLNELGIDVEGVFYFGSQTGRGRQVVSGATVGNDNFHSVPLDGLQAPVRRVS